MVERFNRRLGEAIADIPSFRDDARRRGTFASHAERDAFLLDFVTAYNRTRLRCLGYRAPIEVLNNLLGDNTWAGAPCRTAAPRGRSGKRPTVRPARRPCATGDMGDSSDRRHG